MNDFGLVDRDLTGLIVLQGREYGPSESMRFPLDWAGEMVGPLADRKVKIAPANAIVYKQEITTLLYESR